MKRLSIMLLASTLWSGCGDTTPEEVNTLQTQEAAAATCNCNGGEGWLCVWNWNNATQTWKYVNIEQKCPVVGSSTCYEYPAAAVQCSAPCVQWAVYPGPCS